MMNFYKEFIFATCVFLFLCSGTANAGSVVSSDSRIRYLMYDPNEVFKVTVNFGYKSYIEFAKDEYPKTVAIGSGALWDTRILDNKLFLNPLSAKSHTNMIVFTTKGRSYIFDLNPPEIHNAFFNEGENKKHVGRHADSETIHLTDDTDSYNRDMSFSIRFFYPEDDMEDAPDTSFVNDEVDESPQDTQLAVATSIIDRRNRQSHYEYSSDENSIDLVPLEIFDDGSLTYLKFRDKIGGVKRAVPGIYSVNESDSSNSRLKILSFDGYLIVKGIHRRLKIEFKNERVEIINSTF